MTTEESKPTFKISRNLLFIGLVSLFTDMASEMIYPVLPLYLESIGVSIIGIGILEGIAQATAGLSKGYFGRWSDLSGRRLPFVQFGYFLSAISKPMLAFATTGWFVLASRFGDRLGKGIRSGARDAILSQEAIEGNRGRVFGFHKAMDSFGAALGPLLALAYLWIYPAQYKMLFILAFIPGLIAVFSTYRIREKETSQSTKKVRPKLRDILQYFASSSKTYKKLIIGLLLFSLINSTDLFLLLYLKTIGWQDFQIILIYIFYNLAFALAAYPAGSLADRFSLKQIFSIGILLFSVSYIGLGWSTQLSGGIIVSLFVIYGLYAACTEGIQKAWITQVVQGKEVASAIGNFEALNSIATMLASSIGGLIWYYFGSQVFFIGTGFVALSVVVYYYVWLREEE